jgi:hypothetical protein
LRFLGSLFMGRIFNFARVMSGENNRRMQNWEFRIRIEGN